MGEGVKTHLKTVHLLPSCGVRLIKARKHSTKGDTDGRGGKECRIYLYVQFNGSIAAFGNLGRRCTGKRKSVKLRGESLVGRKDSGMGEKRVIGPVGLVSPPESKGEEHLMGKENKGVKALGSHPLYTRRSSSTVEKPFCRKNSVREMVN